MFPFQVHAQLSQQTKIHFDNPQESVFYVPSPDVVEQAQAAYLASLPKSPPARQISRPSGDYGGSCVTYAKKITGRTNEVWGNGGRALKLTQTPFLGAVVVFTYIHVAIVTGIVGDMLYITESNYSARNTISSRSLSVTDSTIKGFN